MYPEDEEPPAGFTRLDGLNEGGKGALEYRRGLQVSPLFRCRPDHPDSLLHQTVAVAKPKHQMVDKGIMVWS